MFPRRYKLFRQLRNKEIYAAGTMRRGRSGLPPQIGGPILKNIIGGQRQLPLET